mmetsp:Transcript_63316/g.100696  ORF Transcript_63316/g.100696 Transcript_63316/m.100696 type:complete len:240 (-) Transcript_63316:783-1502(-)
MPNLDHCHPESVHFENQRHLQIPIHSGHLGHDQSGGSTASNHQRRLCDQDHRQTHVRPQDAQDRDPNPEETRVSIYRAVVRPDRDQKVPLHRDGEMRRRRALRPNRRARRRQFYRRGLLLDTAPNRRRSALYAPDWHRTSRPEARERAVCLPQLDQEGEDCRFWHLQTLRREPYATAADEHCSGHHLVHCSGSAVAESIRLHGGLLVDWRDNVYFAVRLSAVLWRRRQGSDPGHHRRRT